MKSVFCIHYTSFNNSLIESIQDFIDLCLVCLERHDRKETVLFVNINKVDPHQIQS